MRKLVPIFLGTAGLGFLGIMLAARKMRSGKVIAYETSVRTIPQTTYAQPKSVPAQPKSISAQPRNYVQTITIPKQLSLEIVNSARKWADVRGVPLQEILATILVESSGKQRAWNCQPGPRPNGCTKENSRGLMQVNINAWKPLLASNGLMVDDLYNVDANIQIGSYIYAKYRKEVQNLIAKSGVRQTMPIGTITRLYYKGPRYVSDAIRAGRVLGTTPATRPYKQTAEAVANWDSAMAKVSAVA